MSLTSLAPPFRRSSTILRVWNASSSGRWPTLSSVVCSGCSRKQLHQLVLALGIERRCRLVKHDDVGLVQEDAREREALLLAARERLVPGRLFLDACRRGARGRHASSASAIVLDRRWLSAASG